MPNPSELTRLYDELEQEKDVARSPNYPKSDREAALRRVRQLEKELGIEGVTYNSGTF